MGSLVEMSAKIVLERGKSNLSSEELIGEIQKIYTALNAIEGNTPIVAPTQEQEKEQEISHIHIAPSMVGVNPLDTIGDTEVKCLICGQGGMTVLKQHLTREHKMTPVDYKSKFGIPSRVSLVSKSYHDQRSQVARASGLGKKKAVAAPAKVVKVAKSQGAVTPISGAVNTGSAKKHNGRPLTSAKNHNSQGDGLVASEAPKLNRFMNTPHIIRRKSSIPHNN